MYGYGCTCTAETDMRRFLTKEEKVEMLREHKEALEKEAQAVKEKIEDLEKKK